MANRNQNQNRQEQERKGRQNREDQGNVEFSREFDAIPQDNEQNESRKNNKRNR